MNILNSHGLLVAAMLALGTQNVWAHDPAEHAKEAAEAKAAAKCESMHKMDMSKMDPKDPVMQAMMLKCAKKTSTTAHDGMPAMDHSQMKGMKMDHSNMTMPTTKPSNK